MKKIIKKAVDLTVKKGFGAISLVIVTYDPARLIGAVDPVSCSKFGDILIKI
jgi:hypothetical protein